MTTIKQIKIKNFKSFDEEEINLGNFNVLIGANASGKSNFIKIFEFLRDISKSGLNNAVSMQGGVEYLRNINIGSSEDFSVTIVFDAEEFRLTQFRSKEQKTGIKVKFSKVIYEFALNFSKESEFEVVNDKLTLKCEFVRCGEKTSEKEKENPEGEIIFSCANGKVKIDLNKPEEVQIKKEELFPFGEIEVPPKTTLLETPFFSLFFPVQLDRHISISIYDFDPKLPKKATPITGKVELEGDGSNLSIVLKNIIEDKGKKRMLFNLVKDILPFIEDLDIEKFGDKLLFNLKETYSTKQSFPASLISDGTINITALIIALYFEKKQITIIEEPERNLHPYLISKVVGMMRDASQNKQIIVTTHNPEILKHCGVENILLVSRNKDGFSKISRPSDKEEVKTFLKNEIGIEELYVQRLLEEYGE